MYMRVLHWTGLYLTCTDQGTGTISPRGVPRTASQDSFEGNISWSNRAKVWDPICTCTSILMWLKKVIVNMQMEIVGSDLSYMCPAEQILVIHICTYNMIPIFTKPISLKVCQFDISLCPMCVAKIPIHIQPWLIHNDTRMSNVLRAVCPTCSLI